jgi:uncharacterized protein
MQKAHLTISRRTLRQFILGQQGLFPGRRWRGKEGVAQALNAGAVVQIDPLNMVARAHELTLHSRVLDYQPALLDELMYTDRQFFDWGGTVMVYPMEALPYWRVAMARKIQHPRRQVFFKEHAAAVETALAAVREAGPTGSRDLSGKRVTQWSYRSGKDTGQALYHLWIAGELMTHSRRGFERLYDLRERIAPPHLDDIAPLDAAEAYFERQVFSALGMTTGRGFRGWFAGSIERPVNAGEAQARLAALQAAGVVAQVIVDDEPKEPRYVLAEHLPLLEALHRAELPAAWLPLETDTTLEVTFLSPLEIVSARGRAKPLFGFEYLWEVYKPVEKRRWGYYTLPVLYGDRLVARFDSRLERAAGELVLLGFWLEEGVALDAPFGEALRRGFGRFLSFLGAERLVFGEGISGDVRTALEGVQSG